MCYYPAVTETYEVMFNTLIYLGYAQFLVIIGIHIWKYNLRHCTLFAKCERIIVSTYQHNVSRNSLPDSISLSTGRYENFRDELLALYTGDKAS